MAISFASAPPDLAATPTSPTGTPPREGTHHERRQSKGPAGPQPSGPARALAAHVERL